MEQKANEDVRALAREKGVRLWQIADCIGIHEKTLVCRMRKELPEEQKKEICCIINDLSEVRGVS